MKQQTNLEKWVMAFVLYPILAWKIMRVMFKLKRLSREQSE